MEYTEDLEVLAKINDKRIARFKVFYFFIIDVAAPYLILLKF